MGCECLLPLSLVSRTKISCRWRLGKSLYNHLPTEAHYRPYPGVPVSDRLEILLHRTHQVESTSRRLKMLLDIDYLMILKLSECKSKS